MKLFLDSRIERRAHDQAFTMVEIALCLAIIGFAMVAIIGVLPTGLQVQQSNREDTIINEDGAFWMQAIKGASQGLYDLPRYVDEIQVSPYPRYSGVPSFSNYFVNNYPAITNLPPQKIIGLLSTPKYRYATDLNYTNIYARVRAIGGSVAEKNSISRDMAFSYMMQVEIQPYSPYPSNFFGTNLNNVTSGSAEAVDRTNSFLRGMSLSTNLFEIRLTMRWPVYGTTNRWRVGNNRQTFRSLVNARMSMQSEGQLGRATHYYFLNSSAHGPFIF